MTDGSTHEQGNVIAPSPIESIVGDAAREIRMDNHKKALERKWDGRVVGAFAGVGGGLVLLDIVRHLLNVGSFGAELAGGAIVGLGYATYRAIRGLFKTTAKNERAVEISRP